VSQTEPKASLVGDAGQRWLRGGARSGRVDSRLGFGHMVASWSRKLDPSGQI
jgi:hypothetical protein